jgi:hypothetical protein
MQNNLVDYLQGLEALPVKTQSITSALAEAICSQKLAEAERIVSRGLAVMVNSLHSQGMRYDEILMLLGCTVEQAQALIVAKNLYPPQFLALRNDLHYHSDRGVSIGLLMSPEAEVLDVGTITKSRFQHHNNWPMLDGFYLNCRKNKVAKADLLWLQTEVWWNTAQKVNLSNSVS